VQRQLCRTGRIGENRDAAGRDGIRRKLGAVTSSTGQRGKYVARPDELTAGGDAGRSDLRPDEGRAEYLT
jgi:hypothetical protein